MKITVCGSVTFADRLVKIYKQLEQLDHTPLMHQDMFGIANGTAAELIEGITKGHSEIKRQHNFIKFWHDLIGNTFLEMGFAHVNNKKVFLLNPIPTKVPYVDEIQAMTDKIINGNLELIK